MPIKATTNTASDINNKSGALRLQCGPFSGLLKRDADTRFGHPHEVTLRKLEAIPTHRTDQQGNIEVMTDGERHWVSTDR